MKNGFCISKIALNDLLMQRQKGVLLMLLERFKDTFSQAEIVAQMEAGTGAFSEAMTAEINKFSNKTENAEIITSFHLADLYFPDSDPEMCFEMRRDFTADKATSYDGIVAGIENDTEIDCSIKADGRQFNFQIKRYPQKYLPHTREALTKYITETIAGYGSMKGRSLVLLLQPDTEERNDQLSFKQVHEDMVAIKEKISFDEITFVFNDRNQQIFWQQVFPQYGHSVIPLLLLSDKYKAQQEEWKKKTT